MYMYVHCICMDHACLGRLYRRILCVRWNPCIWLSQYFSQNLEQTINLYEYSSRAVRIALQIKILVNFTQCSSKVCQAWNIADLYEANSMPSSSLHKIYLLSGGLTIANPIITQATTVEWCTTVEIIKSAKTIIASTCSMSAKTIIASTCSISRQLQHVTLSSVMK